MKKMMITAIALFTMLLSMEAHCAEHKKVEKSTGQWLLVIVGAHEGRITNMAVSTSVLPTRSACESARSAVYEDMDEWKRQNDFPRLSSPTVKCKPIAN